MIIGIIGYAGSGKDTVASHLVESGFSKLSFASALKDTVAALFGWEREMVDGITKESRVWREIPDIWWEENLDWKNHPLSKFSERFTPRAALQLVGTSVIRTGFHDDFWILRVKRVLEETKGNVVITDCRFHNEIEMVKNSGGKIIRVTRGNKPDWEDIAKDALSESLTSEDSMNEMVSRKVHLSEWGWLNVEPDFVIENNSTVENLKSQITRCFLR